MDASSSTHSHIPGCHHYRPVPHRADAPRHTADVVVLGDTAAGIIAGVQAARMGLQVIVAGFGRRIGGLTSGGLGRTDVGNREAVGGLSREFYRRVGSRYGQDEAWHFEPGVAEDVLRQFASEAGLIILPDCHLARVERDGSRITSLVMESGVTIDGKQFIDASYEGDLLASAGVSWTWGREGRTHYDEALAGVHFSHGAHNFRRFVDPYVVPGQPGSGLLPGISAEDPGRQGDEDRRVQAYNFRLCLTDVPANRLAIPQPADYDPQRYELLRRYLDTGMWDALKLLVKMPNGKTDLNNFGGFSTDYIGANHRWPVAGHAEREHIFQDHLSYTLGLLWFLGNDPRVPAEVRAEAGQWGLPRDEYVDSGHFTPQLYVREARRMVSDVVMTEHDCIGRVATAQPAGFASYQMDSHSCQRVVMGGRAMNEGIVEYGGGFPTAIDWRCLVPKRGECPNLTVPVCISASHIAFGSLRMEPVFMVLGQSAATLSALALAHGCAVQDVPYGELAPRLVADGQFLTWDRGGRLFR